MSRKNNTTSDIIVKRLKELQFTEYHIAQYVMRPVSEISDWLKGKTELPYCIVFQIYEFLEEFPDESPDGRTKKFKDSHRDVNALFYG